MDRLHANYCTSNAPARPCSLHELFVRNDGAVFPCCQTSEHMRMMIGRLGDADLIEKIRALDQPCACRNWKFRAAEAGDVPRYDLLNLELSLACQANCALCCVGSPDWRGHYDQYAALDVVVDATRPRRIKVQGGEVLAQKASMRWLAEVRQRHPETKVSVVTNGNAALHRVDEVEAIFDAMTVSMMAIQPDTYFAAMGLDFARTEAFILETHQRGRTNVFPKYLLTPISTHEVHLFLRWVLERGFPKVSIATTRLPAYVQMEGPYDYWRKIFHAAGRRLVEELAAQADAMRGTNTTVWLDPDVLKYLGIDMAELAPLGLTAHVRVLGHADG